jgi:hypothetical protein
MNQEPGNDEGREKRLNADKSSNLVVLYLLLMLIVLCSCVNDHAQGSPFGELLA